MGGSAYSMAHQIGEGYLLVTERTFQRFQRGDLEKLGFEMEKLMREIRAEQPNLDDVQAIQHKNRRIGRLRGALVILQNYKSRMR